MIREPDGQRRDTHAAEVYYGFACNGQPGSEYDHDHAMREPDRFQHDDAFRESHASDGTAFGHVGQPSTPIDDEIERGAKWEMLALQYIEGVPDVRRLVNDFVRARTNHTRLAGMGKLSFAGIEAQSKYAAARIALDKLAAEGR